MPRVGKKHFPYTPKGRQAAASFRKMMEDDREKKPPIGTPHPTKQPKTPRTPTGGSSGGRTSPGERDAYQAAAERRKKLMEARQERTLDADAKAKGVTLPPRSSQQRGRRRR